jgi:hypothetical protein
MKRIILLMLWQFGLLPGVMNVFADVVTMKDGSQVSGQVESGTEKDIRIKSADGSYSIVIDQIQSIQFDSPGGLITSGSTPSGSPAPALPQSITLPVGTEIAVRTIDRIDSKTADLNKEYAASLDDPLVVDGATVAPANANAFLRVTDVKHPKIKGRDSLSISLIAVVVNGQRVKVETGNVDSQSGSRAKSTATGAIAGGATGAVIGAVAGGGVGAAIGALAGGGAGAALGNVMGRKPVEIAPETRFTYKLTQPVAINSQEGSR